MNITKSTTLVKYGVFKFLFHLAPNMFVNNNTKELELANSKAAEVTALEGRVTAP